MDIEPPRRTGSRMAEWLRKRAFGARGIACGGIAMLLAALASGCTASSTSNASLTTANVSAGGPTIAFDSIDGPPSGVFNRLVDNLSSEAQSRNLAIASRVGAANYRVRGYMAAQVIRGRTHISWVWDVYDDDKLRALRIVGEEPASGRGGDPWGAADEQMLRKIARSSMDRLAAFVANPAGPLPADTGIAIATSDEPEPAVPASRKRRARTAGTAAEPSAAERLALTASR